MAKRTARAPQAIVIQAPRARSVARRQSGRLSRRRRRSFGGRAASVGAGLLSSERVGAVVGGFILGMLDKQGTKLPTVPVLGRAGTLGVASYYIGKSMHSAAVLHAATGFLSIAAYELARQGTIAGDDQTSV